ncbi:DUF1361 domain-containing protein [Merismopedia glauca]|nr:DUF1361 domain-containing protein [Merismopedia glauca]
MAWNLFLALVPLFISFWLFYRPRSRWFIWSVSLLTGLTFVWGIKGGNWFKLLGLAQSIQRNYQELDLIYFGGAIALTLFLMLSDLYFWSGRGARSFFWWLGFLLFILFLPNAPYVLTDVIHLIEDIEIYQSIWLITLVIIPFYLLFMFIGQEAYVLSLIYLGEYLRRQNLSKYILPIELLFHFLSAVGIFLGRFLRLNSWYVFTKPSSLIDSASELMGKFPLLVIAISFIVLTILYGTMKEITLAILAKRNRKSIFSESSSGTDGSFFR